MSRGRVLPNDQSSGPLTIELAIRLSDGSFETKVVVPIDCDETTRNKSVDRWLAKQCLLALPILARLSRSRRSPPMPPDLPTRLIGLGLIGLVALGLIYVFGGGVITVPQNSPGYVRSSPGA